MKRTPLSSNRGFSLVELILVMAIFMIIIAVTGDTFSRIMTQSSVQSRTATSNIEGLVGLEVMRKDLASAGFGLPWSFAAPITYNEVVAGPGQRETIAAAYNATSNQVLQTLPPSAVSGGNNSTLTDSTQQIPGSDYLVIRASSVGLSPDAQRWSFMNYTSVSKPTSIPPQSWTKDNIDDDSWVVAIKVGLTSSVSKELVINTSNAFTTQYKFLNSAGFAPDESKVTSYVYGISDSTQPRMPFNRADYYVRIPASSDINLLPKRCAPNTGILYKAVVDQSNGTVTASELPLLDCVADMQVVYTLESSSSGLITETDSLAGLSADNIRNQLKSIQVYILSHEGGRDSLYTYPNSSILVGPTSVIGRNFDISTTIGSGWQRYRWKVYHISVNPANLGSTL